MFCPICQSALHERTLLDPNIQGYACNNGAVFYATLIEQAGGIPIAATIRPPAMSDDSQILKFWLSDRHARERVPNQLAVLCRRMVESADDNRQVASVADPFVFCPTCSEALVRFDSDDVYMQGCGAVAVMSFGREGRRSIMSTAA